MSSRHIDPIIVVIVLFRYCPSKLTGGKVEGPSPSNRVIRTHLSENIGNYLGLVCIFGDFILQMAVIKQDKLCSTCILQVLYLTMLLLMLEYCD